MVTAALDRHGVETGTASSRWPIAPPALLGVHGLSKRFGRLVALEDARLSVAPGEVHCLLGENGAGKSTLCNLVFGVHQPDAGHLELAGSRFEPESPAHALEAGVAMVHQHFSLVGRMTALENLLLGRRGRRGLAREVRARAAAVSAEFGFDLDFERRIDELSVGERQRTEIVKCLLSEPRLLVLDEPTAVLPPREIGGLLEFCRRLAEKGASVLLVTHKLAEIGAVADRTSVLRRGRVVETVERRDADFGALVRAMVGREVRALSFEPQRPAPKESAGRPPALAVEALSVEDAEGQEKLHVSFEVGAGEIVGVAGVEGNGQSELGRALSGLEPLASGRILLGGEDVTRLPPRALTRRGLGSVPEDRHAVGCHTELSVAENLFLGELRRFARFGLIRHQALAAAAEERLRAFDVRGTPEARFGNLSGGNQQKVVLARELGLSPLVCLVASQPTRGLDVGAVEFVYQAIRRARDGGAGVLLISSELDELLAVADRIIVLYRGRVVGTLPGGPEQHEHVGRLMSGHGADSARAS